MGKLILLLALGISSLTGFYFQKSSSAIPSNKILTTKNSEDSHAKEIANSGINFFLERLKKEKSLKGNFTGNKLLGGEYSVYISGPDSNLTIRSIGSYHNSNHEVIVKANRSRLKLPSMQAALNVISENLKVSIDNNIEIKFDDGNELTSNYSSGNLSHIFVQSLSDSAYLRSLLKSDCTISVGSITNDWDEIYSGLISSSDISLPGGIYSSNIFLGDISRPKITYISGDVHFSGNSSGNGILIVNGNLKLSGDFSYKGLIIINSNSNLSFTTENNSRISGSVLVSAKDIDLKLKDNSKIIYDFEGIKKITAKLKSSKVEIISWW